MSARYNPAIAPDPPRPPLTRGHCATLGLILAAALALRVLYLIHALHSPGYVWEDPDGYAQQAGLAFVELEVTPPFGKEEIHVSVAGR